MGDVVRLRVGHARLAPQAGDRGRDRLALGQCQQLRVRVGAGAARARMRVSNAPRDIRTRSGHVADDHLVGQ